MNVASKLNKIECLDNTKDEGGEVNHFKFTPNKFTPNKGDSNKIE